MRHAKCARHLSQYVDDTLDSRTRRAMEDHIAGCTPCRDELGELRRTVHLLGTLAGRGDPLPPIGDRVLARIQDGEGRPSFWGRIAGGWQRGLDSAWGPPLATAAVGLALLVVVQGVEIEVTVPGLRSDSSELRVARAPSSRVPVPVAPAVGPLASRRRNEAEPVTPVFSTCVQRASAPECAPWNAWLVGLGMREPENFLREVEAVPMLSRNRWLGELSRFAASSGSGTVLATKLRQSGDPLAETVASHFERPGSAPRFDRGSIRVDRSGARSRFDQPPAAASFEPGGPRR